MSAEENSNQRSANSVPEPSSDGPQSRLGHYYDHAVNQTLEKFLKSIKYSLFKEKFPELSKECGQDLREVQKELIIQLRSTITSDIKDLSNETDLFKSLKSLDDTINEQKQRVGENSWRPSGIPENDIRDHIYCQKLKHKNYLEFLLETAKGENEKYETSVEENHVELLKLKEEFENDYQEVQSNLAAFSDLGFQKLREDIHSMLGKR